MVARRNSNKRRGIVEAPIKLACESTQKQAALTIRFGSAVVASVFTLLFVGLALGSLLVHPPEAWRRIVAYAESFRLFEMASFVPAFFLAPIIVVRMACVYEAAPTSKKVFGLSGLATASVSAATIPTNYYLQLFVVRLNLKSGPLDGLTLLAHPNLHSLFFALETLGYAFLSVATLFASQGFWGGNHLATGTRWLLFVSGVVGVFGVIVAPFDQPNLLFAGLGIGCLAFPIAMILLTVWFGQSRSSWLHEASLHSFAAQLPSK